jgi:hypothetical protein
MTKHRINLPKDTSLHGYLRGLLVVALLCFAGATVGVSAAKADSTGTIGPVTFGDQNFYCKYDATRTNYGVVQVQGVSFAAPLMYAAPGYARQTVAWRFDMYQIFSNGSIQFAKTSNWNYGQATSTTAAALQTVTWAGVPFIHGNYVVVVELAWFNTSGNLSGYYSGWWNTFVNISNGYSFSSSYCIL